ncbi:putative clathrin assembly protein At4g32285 [Silene latifolia]|uniref:putative clathrin assembly protein At4g32285 n=1 Tax=Silene latifolia TaxID=37657 RepID=UPI003D777F75
MAPKGTIRKAIGVVKDQTRISIAKVASNIDPFLDILIVKATSHDDIVPNEKYFNEILRRSSISKPLRTECVELISKRIEKTHDWIVALKCLILVHRLMSNGDEVFMQEIACVNESNVKGYGMLSNMCVFKDDAHTNSWDYTDFVRNYGMYLDEKVEWIVQMWLNRRLRVSGKDEGSTKTVLRRMEQLQRLLERVLAMRPRNVSKHQKLVVLALCPVVEESFKLYNDICEGLSFLLDLFWGMEYWNIVKSLGTYVTVAKQIDELVEFYAWCKDFGVVTALEYPVVERISNDLLSTMEKFMKKKANDLKSTEKNKKTKNRSQESSFGTSPTVGLEAISENMVDEIQDLIDLKNDEAVEEDRCEDPGLPLSLALFCENTTESETKFDDQVITDWELALIESASTLMTRKPEMGGGFDDLLLESMYNQKPASENTICSEMISGGNGVVALQNPFAASATVLPPAYVQVAGLETQREMLGKELQVLEQYGTNGMEGQVSSAQNDVVSSYNAFGPQAMVPFELTGNSGNPGGHHYNPWSD